MEWAVAQCASKSISQTNTQQPESLPESREEMAGRGWDRGEGQKNLDFFSSSFFHPYSLFDRCCNAHTFPYFYFQLHSDFIYLYFS